MTKLKTPKLIGHRGCAAYAPENTLEGIHTAADMDIPWVELDVKLTRDQVPIIFHDDTLDRTTNGAGKVAETDYADLKQLEAGSWFADSFAGIKIPTLEEALDVLLERDLGLNLEIKPCEGREKETAEAALDILSQVWDEPDKLIVSSFQHVSLECAQDMIEDFPRGLLLPEEWPENWAEIADYLKVSAFILNGNTVERKHVESLIDLDSSDQKRPVLAYTVNQPDRARILQSWGVDGFISDEPDVITDGLLTVH